MLLSLLTGAFAQYSVAPFYDYTHRLSQAFGLEVMLGRLHALEALGDDADEEFEEQVEKLLGRDFGRFGGSLAAIDPELAEAFAEALEEVEEAFEDGDDLGPVIAEARALHAQAYAALFNDDIRLSPAFIGANIVALLLEDDGVGEAYEDAAEEELWEYPNGWGALQRVKELWAGIEHLATAERRADFQEMVDFLETVVYPTVVPPAAITGNPEEAEGATQRMAGIVEETVAADLFPARDLARLNDQLIDVLVPACQAYDAGDADLGVEGAYAVRNPYRKHLRRLLDLIAPEIHVPAAAILDTLVGAEDDDDDEEEEAAEASAFDPAGACWELHELLVQARTFL